VFNIRTVKVGLNNTAGVQVSSDPDFEMPKNAAELTAFAQQYLQVLRLIV